MGAIAPALAADATRSQPPTALESVESLADSSLTLRNALDIANRTGSVSDRIHVLQMAAQYSFSSGQAADARQYLQAALQLIPQLESALEQSSAHLAIADRYAASDQPEAAQMQLEAAAQLAENVADPLQRGKQWMAIASRYANLLQPAASGAALDKAQQAITAAPPSSQQAIALSQLAIQFADLGQSQTAATLVIQSQRMLTAVEAGDEPRQNEQASQAVETASGFTPRPWNGTVGLQSSLFSGDRTRGGVTLSGNAERQWRRHFLDLSLRLAYDFDNGRDDPDLFSGQGIIDSLHYGSEAVQLFVNSSVASDNLENLNLRARLATGANFRVLQDTSDRRLDLRAGVSARYESFEDQGDEFNPVSASLGINYQDIWFRALRLKQALTVDIPLNESENLLFQSQTDLGIPISDRWSVNNSARLTLSGDPADDNPPLLFNLQTGLQYAF